MARLLDERLELRSGNQTVQIRRLGQAGSSRSDGAPVWGTLLLPLEQQIP